MAEVDIVSLENRPGILMVGAPNVGKRTVISRLLSIEFDDDLNSKLFAHGWTIDTKYYTADVTLWMAHLSAEELCVNNMPNYGNLAGLVMVFDLNDLKSFDALKKWVHEGSVDLAKFDVLVCVGNKVDRVEGHAAHLEYKTRVMKKKSERLDYGVVENEGRGLLGEEESGVGVGIKKLCVEWCVENGIEYVEACAANAEFDECLSLDGDWQGVERLYGALSAHMWPGMVLKSGNGNVVEPYLPRGEEEEEVVVSDEESDFEFDYEVLSEGSAKPWIDADEGWVSANGPVNGKSAVVHTGESSNRHQEDGTGCSGEREEPSASIAQVHGKSFSFKEAEAHNSDKDEEHELGSHFEFEDLEHLISEIGGVRDSLRLMPDFQRREMAAKLALRMAAMFGGDSEDEDL